MHMIEYACYLSVAIASDVSFGASYRLSAKRSGCEQKPPNLVEYLLAELLGLAPSCGIKQTLA